MQRRTLLTSLGSIGTVGLAGCTAFDAGSDWEPGTAQEPVEQNPELVDKESVPESVIDVEPLMKSVAETVHEYYPDSSIYVNQQGEIYMDYTTSKSTPEGVEAEMHQIADLYAEAARGYDPVTFTIVTGEISMIVPQNTVEMYINDELDKEAFHKTLGIMAKDNK